ncbi:LLM class flavin-dependent oxidoreductase [Salipiger manganoxidans]|uniref:LLM class flavin-dependent oxidoreductase n=1 Tax=Salipiger marinus TaxID=555512 RepID=UPI001E522B41|nr:LLM class flavin-dependent oxidoreductase [Salipiger manganoxidans]MCD1617999.1 LLM class flavin-dependent oxidoreductase [Salipiger manganoxidans]
MTKKMMRLGLSMRGLGYHPAAWRHPDVPVNGASEIEHYHTVARHAERGKIDMIFFADGAGVRAKDTPKGSLARLGQYITDIEPTVLLASISAVTTHLGLVTTASTAYNEPYNLARRFAGLDLMSHGRAGWNIVASWSNEEAKNFGLEQVRDYGERYERAAECAEAVTGLWDSWEDGAFVLDKESGVFFDESRMHRLNFEGKHFKVRGPLNARPSEQGRPIVVQAGNSPAGRDIGAKLAEVIYTASNTIEDALTYYADMRERLAKFGRPPDALRVMPGFRTYIGRSREEAQEKFEMLQDLIDPVVGLSFLADTFGDLSGLPLDEPIPADFKPAGDREGISGWADRLIARSRQDGKTIRELYLEQAGQASSNYIGTAADIADIMEDWFHKEACDGFNLTVPHLPGGAADVSDLLVPELQRRGLFRTEYEGRTLRENLGLPPHRNRYTGADRVREASIA